MAGRITEYPNSLLAVNVDAADLIDVSHDTGGAVFESQKMLLTEAKTFFEKNIASEDLTFGASRDHNLNGFDLSFDVDKFYFDSSEGSMGFETSSPLARIHIFEVSTVTDVSIRLDVDSTSTWDLVAQATGPRFEIRDVVNGLIPFKINETTSTDTVILDPVGFGLFTTPTSKVHFALGTGDFAVDTTELSNILFIDGTNDHINIGTATDLGALLTVDNTDDGSNQFGARFRSISTAVSRETVVIENLSTGGALKVTANATFAGATFLNTGSTASSYAASFSNTGGGGHCIQTQSTVAGRSGVQADYTVAGGIAISLVSQNSGTMMEIRQLGGGSTLMELKLGNINATSNTLLGIQLDYNQALTTNNTGNLHVFRRDGSSTGEFQGDHIRIEEGSIRSVGNSFHILQNGALAFKVQGDGVSVFKSFTVATLPTVVAGGLIRVSDETGGDTLAYSDGTNWKRVSDGTNVA